MIRRSHGCFISETDHQPRTKPTKHLGQLNAAFKAIKKLAIGKLKRDSGFNAQNFRCILRFFQTNLRTWGKRCRLAIRQDLPEAADW